MPKPPLRVGSIGCALFSRGDGTFHWTLVIPTDTGNALKIHATNSQGSWVYKKAKHYLAGSATICVVVKIGQTTPTNTIDHIYGLLKEIPMEVPAVFKDTESTFTCRVWFKEACRLMAAKGIIKCPDVTALEKEIRGYGDKHAPRAAAGDDYKSHAASSA